MKLIAMKTATITSKGQISLPKESRKNFRTGSKVAILSFSDRIEIRPIKEFSDKMFCAIASEQSLAEDWDSPEEDEAWKDL